MVGSRHAECGQRNQSVGADHPFVLGGGDHAALFAQFSPSIKAAKSAL
jgi:hypothetical protein